MKMKQKIQKFHSHISDLEINLKYFAWWMPKMKIFVYEFNEYNRDYSSAARTKEHLL